MRPRSRIQTTGQNNGHQLRDYSKSSNRSENRPLICANPDSDLDVAVIVPEPEITDHWEQSANLWGDVLKVSTLIEPVLMEDNEDSMLYREVIRTGITV